MRFRPLALVAALFVVPGCIGAGSSHPAEKLPSKPPGRYNATLESGGVNRRYILQVPKAYDATRRLPLVVLLHGWMGNASGIMSYSGMARKAESEGFVLVAPEGLGEPQGWNASFIDLSGQKQHPDDVGFVTKVMDQVEREVGIDGDRVFVVGHSNGAMLAHLMASKLSSRIAAFGAVAGTIGLPGVNGGGPLVIPAPTTPVSGILLHGQADAMVSYDEKHRGLLASLGAPTSARWWADKDGCATSPTQVKSPDGTTITDTYAAGRDGTEVALVTYPSGSHDWPSNGADLIWKFLESHSKSRH